MVKKTYLVLVYRQNVDYQSGNQDFVTNSMPIIQNQQISVAFANNFSPTKHSKFPPTNIYVNMYRGRSYTPEEKRLANERLKKMISNPKIKIKFIKEVPEMKWDVETENRLYESNKKKTERRNKTKTVPLVDCVFDRNQQLIPDVRFKHITRRFRGDCISLCGLSRETYVDFLNNQPCTALLPGYHIAMTEGENYGFRFIELG